LTGSLRLFVAVDPTDAARRRIAEVQQSLKRATTARGWKASFPKPENLHLTLKFLGSVEADRVPDLRSGLAEIGATDRFEICFEGVSGFPGRGTPRILWLGVTAGAGELKTLAEQVDRCCASLGFEPEAREFSPHLTLGRVKNGRGSLASVVDNVSPKEAGSSLVTEVTLYRSELGPGGSTYTPLEKIPLRAPD
jgi:2'-5' RNA ligase